MLPRQRLHDLPPGRLGGSPTMIKFYPWIPAISWPSNPATTQLGTPVLEFGSHIEGRAETPRPPPPLPGGAHRFAPDQKEKSSRKDRKISLPLCGPLGEPKDGLVCSRGPTKAYCLRFGLAQL